MTINVQPERSTLTLPGLRTRPDQATLRAGPNGITQPGPPQRETPAVAVSKGATGDAAGLRAATAGLDRAASVTDAGLAAADLVISLLTSLRDGGAIDDAGLADWTARVEAAVEEGAFDGVNLLKGDAPGGALKLDADGEGELTVRGYDLRPGGPIVRIKLDDPQPVPAQADVALARTEEARAALEADSKRVGAHRAFVGLLSDAVSAGGQSLDVDGARLAALSVKQTISGTSLTLSNGGPQSVLSLFR